MTSLRRYPLVISVALACVLYFYSPTRLCAAEPEPTQTILVERATNLWQILYKKNIRHVWLRDALTPFFIDTQARDRFLLNLVASLERKKITDAVIRRGQWSITQIDSSFGFAQTQMKICGRWHRVFPRCIKTTFEWRLLDNIWYLVPPNTIYLDAK